MSEPTPSPGPVPKYRKVRGWLLLFSILVTLVVPLGLLFRLVVEITAVVEGRGAAIARSVFLPMIGTDALAAVGLAAMSLVAGLSLWRRRRPAVPLAKLFLVLYGAYNLASRGVLSVLSSTETSGLDPIRGISVASAVGLWYLYLMRSKRVRATYGDASIESTVRDRLLAAQDLAELRGSTSGLRSWIAAAFFLASLLTAQLATTLALNIWGISSGGGRSRKVGELFQGPELTARLADFLLPLLAGLLFAWLCSAAASCWQRAAAWGAVSAAVFAAGLGLGSNAQPRVFPSIYQVTGIFPGDPSATAVGALVGFSPVWMVVEVFLSGTLVMAALLLAIRRWGVRPSSVVGGVLVADLLRVPFVLYHFQAMWGALRHDWPQAGALLRGVIEGLVFGLVLYAGFLAATMWSTRRDLAGETGSRQGLPRCS